MKFKLVIFIFTVAMALSLLTGCMTRKHIERNQYLLNIDIPKTVDHRAKTPLVLYPISVRAPFNQLNFLYRISSNRYLTDYYNGFLISPAEQLYPVLKKFLVKEGHFNLINEPSQSQETIKLQVEVTEFYADYRDRKNPKAVTAINFFASRKNSLGKEITLLNKTFSMAMPLHAKTTESLLSVWNLSFKILFLRGIHKINSLEKTIPHI